MPENTIALELIKQSNTPIVAPSANISGSPSGTNIEDIKEELDGKVDAMIDGGDTQIGIESTVVKVIGNVPTILRPGKVTKEDIIKAVGVCNIAKNVMEQVKQNEKAESPGMKYKHYAPKTKCVLVCGDEEKQISKVNELIKEQEKENKKVCVIGYTEHKDKINVNTFLSMGSIKSFEEISHNIFMILRKADKKNVDIIIIEGMKKEGLKLAIFNRLIKTCEYNVYNDEEV